MAVPNGLIAIWTGTLATIPANWSLCDGAGGRPNLIARFLRGANVSGDIGTTGGADNHGHASSTAAGSHSHTIELTSHSHTTNSAGSHYHGAYIVTYDDPYLNAGKTTTGAHTHTTNSDAGHTHTTPSQANHTHTIDTVDGRPPFYEVAFIQSNGSGNITTGIVIIWTGTLATIPVGWSLCDGVGGRPDLRSRFLRGVNTGGTDPGTTGGATTHLHNVQNTGTAHTHGGTSDAGGTHSHTHSAYTWTHNHNSLTFTNSPSEDIYSQTDSGAGNHTHAATDSIGSHTHTINSAGTHSHTCESSSSLPAFYEVAYIISTGAVTMPLNGILIWTGTVLTIPADYTWCDGSGTTPNLKQKFVKGAAAGVDPGGGGGADTHTHTENGDAGGHGHTVVANGSHQHSATDSIGSHTHAYSLPHSWPFSLSTNENLSASSGAHSHTFNNEGSHTHPLTLTPGDHNHEVWSTDDGRPAFYEVAFVQYSGGATGIQDKSSNMVAKLVAGGII